MEENTSVSYHQDAANVALMVQMNKHLSVKS